MSRVNLDRLIKDLEGLSIEERRELYRALRDDLAANGAAETTRERTTGQREALQALHADLIRLPVANPSDGFSNRDHDQALYGEGT